MSLSKAERLEEINDKIRAQLFRKGVTGLRGLGRVFKQADNSGNNQLDLDEFEDALTFAGIFLSASELKMLFNAYDDSGDGNVSYQEFLTGLAPPLSGARLSVVEAAFNKLDSDGSGALTVSDIAGMYRADQHPQFLAGQKTIKQLMTEFLSNFEGRVAGASKGDGVVTYKEFVDYYTDVSASIPSDEYFVTAIAKCFDVSKADTTSKVRTLCAVLREKAEQRAKGNRNPTDTLRSTFKFFDEDESGGVGKNEFKAALERFGLPLSDKDLDHFFRAFDQDGSDSIKYDEFVTMVFDEQLGGK